MYDNIFNIDYSRWVANQLPIRRRTQKLLQWLLCLISPISKLYQQFLQYRDITNYKLDHTAQVYSLEDVLNDAFDRAQRRIYIKDGDYIFPVWFYDRATDKPVPFFDRADNQPVRFYDRSSLEKLEVDFTIVLPKGINLPPAEIIRLRALTDFYRLPDKTYTIAYE